MRHTICLGFLVALAAWFVGVDEAAAQRDLYSSPTVDFYVKRTQARDRIDSRDVGMTGIVRGDLNRGRPQGAATYQPSFLQGGGAGAVGPVQKPFTNASHRPAVSPYLNLMREDLTDEFVPNYHTLVRPQLQQIEFQQQQQQANTMMYRQLQQIQARTAFTPQGSETMLPTGHVTTFQNLGGYYPALAGGRRR